MIARMCRRHRRTGGQHRPTVVAGAGCRRLVSPWTAERISQQAISFGAQAIMSGTADHRGRPGGVLQSMSQIPIVGDDVGEQFGFTSPTNESKQWLHRYGDQEISRSVARVIAEVEPVP